MDEQYDDMLHWLNAELQPDAPGPSKPGVRQGRLQDTAQLTISAWDSLVTPPAPGAHIFASGSQIFWNGPTTVRVSADNTSVSSAGHFGAQRAAAPTSTSASLQRGNGKAGSAGKTN